MTIALQAMKDMNLTPTPRIMTVTLVAVTMRCTTDYPKHRALNLLHDMAYYKQIVVKGHVKHITFCSIVVAIQFWIILGRNCHIKIGVIFFIPGMIKFSSENFCVTYLKSNNYLNLVSYCVRRKLISLSHLNTLTKDTFLPFWYSFDP